MTCSALFKKGISEIWESIIAFKEKTTFNGFLQSQRDRQDLEWFESYFQQLWQQNFQANKNIQSAKKELVKKINQKELSPLQAAQILFTKTI
jgi:LAO/AO transport system kinase